MDLHKILWRLVTSKTIILKTHHFSPSKKIKIHIMWICPCTLTYWCTKPSTKHKLKSHASSNIWLLSQIIELMYFQHLASCNMHWILWIWKEINETSKYMLGLNWIRNLTICQQTISMALLSISTMLNLVLSYIFNFGENNYLFHV